MKRIFRSVLPQKVTKERLQKLFPHVVPARWLGVETLKKDGRMVLRLLLSSVNFFKGRGSDQDAAGFGKKYETVDEYLRGEKITPLQLQQRLKKQKLYALICYGFSLAIFVYISLIFKGIGIFNAAIGYLFGVFVLAKGLELTLSVRQIQSGDFKQGLKDLVKR